MKQILFFIFFIFPFSHVFSQTTKSETNKYLNIKNNEIVFGNVVQVKGSKDELYNRCIYWLNSFYKDPTRITQVRDKNTGKISGIHSIKIYDTDTASGKKQQFAKMYYTFSIWLKDNKYKWELNELKLVSKHKENLLDWFDTSRPSYNSERKKYQQQILNFVDKWSSSLKQKLATETSVEKEEEW